MSNLLKEAIADAKAVRATALANAKAALEEAFQPKLEAMLAEKLKNEISDGEYGSDESSETMPMDMSASDDAMDEIMEISDDELNEMLIIVRANGWDRNLSVKQQNKWRS